MSKAFVAERQERQAKQAAGILPSSGAGSDDNGPNFQASAPPPNERRLRYHNQPRFMRQASRSFAGGMRV